MNETRGLEDGTLIPAAGALEFWRLGSASIGAGRSLSSTSSNPKARRSSAVAGIESPPVLVDLGADDVSVFFVQPFEGIVATWRGSHRLMVITSGGERGQGRLALALWAGIAERS